MKKIRIYAISKKQNNLGIFLRNINKFNTLVEVINIFNNNINKAQNLSPKSARAAYSKEFYKYIKPNIFNIALNVDSKEVDSYEFCELIRDKKEVNFFIGGTFGLEIDFVLGLHSISLSKLTFSHSIAQLVLCEQIYRALCIINNHPYHKI